MKKINLNNVAKVVTLAEGKKVSLPIGQVKEVIAIYNRLLGGFTFEQVIEMLNRKKK